MIKNHFCHLVMIENNMKTKPIFGDLGVFCQGVMFALVGDDKLYLKGGSWLDSWFQEFECGRYCLEKKHSTTTVNYYDVTDLAVHNHSYMQPLIHSSKNLAIRQSVFKNHCENARLRNLPNMNVSLERMLKKASICSVPELLELGAEKAFIKVAKVRALNGRETDKRVLLKLYGAINRLQWQLIQQPTVDRLMLKIAESEF
ncbi:TfoX/Sxy family DNA transformation protein [Vibrio salinus]|uniref:TfoX/Sxy family DNA transformation protein n=1 Tax=Vibrio salinus TaxID=2899784 RepID=UPI001E529464|nr:TfoX/Sxy family DNA transformation protein [Vibrio salinus]MCE0492751.1 TfoX/Sxy family DNA transformation protein [Vibrio salinus]